MKNKVTELDSALETLYEMTFNGGVNIRSMGTVTSPESEYENISSKIIEERESLIKRIRYQEPNY